MKYSKIAKYKYRLEEDEFFILPEKLSLPKSNIEHSYFSICKKNGLNEIIVTVKNGYCWDGASGPAMDTKSIMKASLIHDVLYQSIKLRLIDSSNRKLADKILKRICVQEGMQQWRAWYVYLAVRQFGGTFIKLGSEPKTIEI